MAVILKCARKGSGRDKERGIIRSHQVIRWFQLLGLELLGKAGCEVLEVLISEPKGSPDLTLLGGLGGPEGSGGSRGLEGLEGLGGVPILVAQILAVADVKTMGTGPHIFKRDRTLANTFIRDLKDYI
jgi:hypothetical protein